MEFKKSNVLNVKKLMRAFYTAAQTVEENQNTITVKRTKVFEGVLRILQNGINEGTMLKGFKVGQKGENIFLTFPEKNAITGELFTPTSAVKHMHTWFQGRVEEARQPGHKTYYPAILLKKGEEDTRGVLRTFHKGVGRMPSKSGGNGLIKPGGNGII